MYTFSKIRIFELGKFIRKTVLVNTNLELKYREILFEKNGQVYLFLPI